MGMNIFLINNKVITLKKTIVVCIKREKMEAILGWGITFLAKTWRWDLGKKWTERRQERLEEQVERGKQYEQVCVG